MMRRGDDLLFFTAEEIRRQATIRLARIVVLAFTTGIVSALLVNLWR